MSSGDAYKNRQLTPNFELWVEFFVCRHVSLWGFRIRVCPYPEKRNHPSFISIIPTLVIDTSLESLHEYYSMETQKFDFFLKSSKLNFDLCWRTEITLASSISVLRWVVYDTWLERSSRVLQHGNLKIWFY